ncbi:MAG: deoxyribodipyrimidine photo-lyase, partial [Tepidiformaceae bacterium]
MRTSICWFRRDLRLHDHPALTAAVAGGDEVVPVFVLDERLLSGRWPGANRVGFMLESLAALRESLRAAGGDLVVRVGRPEEVIP